MKKDDIPNLENPVKELKLTRTIDAPIEKVFNAWVNPEILSQWSSPDGFTIHDCLIDPRPGGEFSFISNDPSGKEYVNKGVYREIIPLQKIVSSGYVEVEAGVTLIEDYIIATFANENGKTILGIWTRVVNCIPEVLPALEGMEKSWNETLDKLEEVVTNKIKS